MQDDKQSVMMNKVPVCSSPPAAPPPPIESGSSTKEDFYIYPIDHFFCYSRDSHTREKSIKINELILFLRMYNFGGNNEH